MNEDEDAFELLVDSVSQTQGTGLAVYHILMELVLRIARGQPDPSSFLKSMFESISAKIDQTPFETEKKRAHAEELLTLSTFFSVAEKAVRLGKEKGDRGPRSR
jgi:hypothetical protein